VKGVKRSTICDLQRGEIFLIPNDLYDILDAHVGKNIDEIKKEYNNQHDKTIDEYFDFLLQNELVFLTETSELFPELNLKWDYPFEVSNAIIDFDNESKFDLKPLLSQLDKLHCKYVQLRFFDQITIPSLKELFNYLVEIGSIILSIDIIMPFHEKTSKYDLLNFLKKYPRINFFYIYNSNNEEFIKPIRNKRAFIVYTKENLKPSSCGIISSKYFSINIKSFTEGLQFNSCLNGKLSVDREGNIKNCPSMRTSFGNVEDIMLAESLKMTHFKKYWKLTKDHIKICRDCEFRYVCTDCRAYLEDPEDDYSKPLKCGYNPYTNKWDDWSKNPLKRSAIDYYKLT
jgi:SPASM domain peptide maturase of grasp-with-spasm system